MSRLVSTTTDQLLARVRQSGGVAADVDDAVKILTICQQIINVKLQRVITTTALTTLKQKLVYSISSDLTNAIDVVDVTESNRSLTKIKRLSDFSAYETNWFRNITGTRFEAWHQVGRDFLIIYPGKAANSAVSVDHVKATTIYTDYSALTTENMELPDEDVDLVLRLAETVFLARARKVDNIKAVIAELVQTLGLKSELLKS